MADVDALVRQWLLWDRDPITRAQVGEWLLALCNTFFFSFLSLLSSPDFSFFQNNWLLQTTVVRCVD